VFISKGIKSSLQRELDTYYKEIMGGDFNIRQITKGAFTQSRAKLKHTAFIEMNDNVNQTFYDEAPYIVWHDMRLLAADGTRLMLPRHQSITDEFGQIGFGPYADCQRSLAIGSMLYDVLNLLTIDAQLAPYGSSSEKELLHNHLKKVKPGDLLLLDRGYPSVALMFLLKAKKIEFCIRMKEDWLSVKDFADSDQTQRIVKFKLSKKDKNSPLFEDYPELIEQEIICRFISVALENGEKQILCTSLVDSKKYLCEDFGELYHYRWGVEEGYKLFKSRAEIERFSGKTALAVKQDFFAKVFMMSLCAVLAFPIEEKIRKENQQSGNRKHSQKINRTSAFALLQNISIGLFIKRMVKKAIEAFDKITSKTKEIIRPGRKFERKKLTKKIYHMNWKPL
jgi:hypothetical protein